MFTINNTIIVTLLASVVSVYATHSFEAADVGANQEIELEQLESMTNQLGETQYTFKCILGNGKTTHIVCAKSDHATWMLPHDVEQIIRCPPDGEGAAIASAEIIFTATTQNVNCLLMAGGIGSNFIQMKVHVYGTKLMDYTAQFSIY